MDSDVNNSFVINSYMNSSPVNNSYKATTAMSNSYISPSAVDFGSTPNLTTRVGTIMLTSYGEEGGMANGFSSSSIPRLGGLAALAAAIKDDGGAGIGGTVGSSKGRNGVLGDITNHQSLKTSMGRSSQGMGRGGAGLGLNVSQSQFKEGRVTGYRTGRGRANSDASSCLAYTAISSPPSSPPPTHSSVPTSQRLGPRSRYQENDRNNHNHLNFDKNGHARTIPSLPPPGMPTLHQLKLVHDMPDYRSPTYSLYNMYQDQRQEQGRTI
jgi:hypothetical protein